MTSANGHDSPDRRAVSWRTAAYCRGADIRTFFPPPGDHGAIQRALAICALCPVRAPCLRYALSHRERHGVWGGLTEETRETLTRTEPAPAVRVPEQRLRSVD